MIVGDDYQLKNEYGVLLNFIVARNKQCEGVYFIGDLPGFPKTYRNNYGEQPLSELYCNHSKNRMTDDELREIGNRILEVHLNSFGEGRRHTQQNFQHEIGLSSQRSYYTNAGLRRKTK